MTAMATEKMGIMATGGNVQIVMATAMEKMNLLVLSIAIAAAVLTNLKILI